MADAARDENAEQPASEPSMGDLVRELQRLNMRLERLANAQERLLAQDQDNARRAARKAAQVPADIEARVAARVAKIRGQR